MIELFISYLEPKIMLILGILIGILIYITFYNIKNSIEKIVAKKKARRKSSYLTPLLKPFLEEQYKHIPHNLMNSYDYSNNYWWSICKKCNKSFKSTIKENQ